MLVKLTGMSAAENLLLLSKSGELLHPDVKTIDLVDNSSASQPHLYLFIIGNNSLSKMINIPDLIKIALTDTKKSLQDYHQKKMFIQGYHFINEQHQLMSQLAFSIKLLDTFLKQKVGSVQEESKRMIPSMNKMETRYEMFKECFQVDLGRYHQQAESKDRVTSTKMVTNWMKTSDDLARSVEEVLSRVNIVLDTAEEESKNLDSLKLNSCSIEDEELKGLVGKSLALYTQLRRERAGNRQDDSPRLIAQTVVRMLKRRDILLQECQRQFNLLTPCIRSVLDLDLATTLIIADIKQTSNNICKAQLRRQNDIWTLVSAAVRHKKSSNIGQELRSEIEQQLEENESVIQENQDLLHNISTS